jgi:hypothetical protein
MWFMKAQKAKVALGACDWDCKWDSEFEIRSMGGDDMVAGGSKEFGIGIWGNEILIERKGWIGKKEGGEEKADDIWCV